MRFETKRAGPAPDATAPDGTEVRILCGVSRGGLRCFHYHRVPSPGRSRTGPSTSCGMSSRAAAGYGASSATARGLWILMRGLSLSLPTGTHFQFRCDGPEPLTILGATMPPWPGPHEAHAVAGIWPATL